MLIRPVIRPLIRPLVRLPTERGAGSIEAAVRRIFASGVDGYWRDPSDLSTSYQDSAGTTAGAVDSAVGLMLDKSDGAVVSGSDLVSNGTFATDTTGWTAHNYQGFGVTLSVDAGRLRIDNDATNGGNAAGYCSIATVIGQPYRVTFTVTRGTVASPKVLIRNTVAAASIAECTASADGTYTVVFTATATSTLIVLTMNSVSAAQTVYYDNISAKLLPGNHTTQSTGGSRPLLKLVSGYYGDQLDGLDDYVVSTSGGGGSAGFFYCGAVYVGGGAGTARTIWDDRGTNTGYIVRVDTLERLALLVGNGASFTAHVTTNTLPVGETHVITAWDDGTNLGVQIDNTAAATVGRPAAVAGTASFTEGRINGAASQFFVGRLGARVNFKNYCPDATTREQIKRYIAIRSGVSL